MPSYLKYRIKRTSVDETPIIDGYSEEYRNRLIEMGVINPDTDKNIKKYTCANLVKVKDGDSFYYLCLIRQIERNPNLKCITEGSALNQLEDSSIVNGALPLLTLDAFQKSNTASRLPWYHTAFICSYADPYTGLATKIESPNPDVEDTVCFVQCNCYQPHGGLSVSFFDGAVKSSGHFAYLQNLTEFTPEKNVYNDWKTFSDNTGEALPSYFTGGLPSINTTIHPLIPNTPSGIISSIFLMLNARAVVGPCCYWDREEIILYEPYFFRVVDLAKAKIQAGASPQGLKLTDIKTVAEYTYEEGDYFGSSDNDSENKNRLLGRNFDLTLPAAGNNQRIIYILRKEFAGDLVKNDTGHADCKKYGGYHYHNKKYFNPQNCAHPDIEVRYRWGCVCNGGGCFDMDEGRACPGYYNPIMGDKKSKRYAKLENMYPGDTITAASILELMWLSKGGLEWTKEEWEYVWLKPYLWMTVPDFSTNAVENDELLDDEEKLSLSREKRAWIPRVLSQKAEIDITNGVITKGPIIPLPVGSMTANRYIAESAASADLIPNFPSIVRKIEFKPISSINIQWPRSSFTTVTTSERVDDFQTFIDRTKAEKEEKKKPYTKLFVTPNGQYTAIIGSITSGYSDTVYCFNTAFFTDQQIKTTLINHLEKGTYIFKAGQEEIRTIWTKLFSTTRGVSTTTLLASPLLKTTVRDGQFIFRQVPLSTITDYNIIVVAAQNKNSRIDFGFVKIKPIFRHGYVFQESTTFMADWNSWEGYPETFFDISTDGDLAFLGSNYGRIPDGDGGITSFSNTENLQIPPDAGYTTWKSVTIGPPIKDSGITYTDLSPTYVDQPYFANKVKYYDSRSDSTLSEHGKIIENIGNSKWYLLTSCAPYVILLMDPSICNSFTEFIVYYLTGVVTTKAGEQKLIKFVPKIYSQLGRDYPGEKDAVTGEIFNSFNIQSTEASIKVLKDSLGNYEVTKPGPNLELPETDTHPWVIIAKAFDYTTEKYPTGIPIWRYAYDLPWTEASYPSTDVVFDKTDTTLYMHYAYITDIEYKWNHTKKYYNSETQTAKARYSNKADGNLYRTVYKYTPESGTDTIDGFPSAIHGSKTMVAVWPWVTIGCRDVEIQYAWGNNVRTIKVRPSQLNCYGAGPAGYIGVDVGRSGAVGSSASQNLIEGGYRINIPLCGDHDVRRGGNSHYGPLYYPYNVCSFASYNIMNDCMMDFSLMLPEAAYEMYAKGQLDSSFERLRGPTYYQLGCAKVPEIFPAPCQTQFRYTNTIRDAGQNSFAGWSRSRGPVYLEEDISNYLDEGASLSLPKFGNMGRQIWQLNLAYLTKKIWYDDENSKHETHVLDVPRAECCRDISPLITLSGVNPYYFYKFSDLVFNERLRCSYVLNPGYNAGWSLNPDGKDFSANDIRLLSKNRMVGYKDTLTGEEVDPDNDQLAPIMWAWPKSSKDTLSRGIRVIREIPEHLRTEDQTDEWTDSASMYSITTIDCPPYKLMSNGEDISLGPEFNEGESTVYYVIVAESEKFERGVYTPPYIWSKRTNADIKTISDLVEDPALKYRVNADSSFYKVDAPEVYYPNFITSKEPRELTENAGIMCDSSTISGLNFGVPAKKTYPDPSNIKKFEVEFLMTGITLGDRKIESVHLGLTQLLGTWIDTVCPVTLDLTTVCYDAYGAPSSFYNSVFLTNGSADYNNRVSLELQEKYISYNFKFVFKTNVPKLTDDEPMEFKDGSGPGNLIFSDVAWITPTASRGATVFTWGPYSAMWQTTLSTLISGMSFMAYKTTNIYPGLNLYDVDPVTLGKASGTTLLKEEQLIRVKVHRQDHNDYLHEVYGSLQIPSFDVGLQYFEIQYQAAFSELGYTSATVTVSGLSARDNTTQSMTSKYELPLSSPTVSYFTNFPIVKDLVIDFSFLTIMDKSTFEASDFWKESSVGTLGSFISKITLNTLIPRKTGELIKIDQTGFKVTIGDRSYKSSREYSYYTDLEASDFPNPQKYKLPVTKEMVDQLILDRGKGGMWSCSLSGPQNNPRRLPGAPSPQIPVPPFMDGSLTLKGRFWVFDKMHKNTFLVSTGQMDDDYYREPGRRNAGELFDMEKFQQYAFEQTKEMYVSSATYDDKIKATAFIPYSDWQMLRQMTGEEFLTRYPDISIDHSFLSDAQLREIEYSVDFKWYNWDWTAVAKYTFRDAEGSRYGPANGGVETWSAPGHAVDLDRSQEAFELVSTAIPRTYIAYRQGIWVIKFFSTKQTALAWDAPWPPPWAYDQMDDSLDTLLYGSNCPPGQEETCNANERTRNMLNVDYQAHIYTKRYQGTQDEQPYMEWLAQKSLRTRQLAMVGMPGGTGWNWVGLYTNTLEWQSDDYAWPGADLGW